MVTLENKTTIIAMIIGGGHIKFLISFAIKYHIFAFFMTLYMVFNEKITFFFDASRLFSSRIWGSNRAGEYLEVPL